MNGTATFGDQWQRPRAFLRCTLNRHAAIRDESNGDKREAAFGIAVGTSLVCYLLMTRLQNRRASRRSRRDDLSSDGGNYRGRRLEHLQLVRWRQSRIRQLRPAIQAEAISGGGGGARGD